MKTLQLSIFVALSLGFIIPRTYANPPPGSPCKAVVTGNLQLNFDCVPYAVFDNVENVTGVSFMMPRLLVGIRDFSFYSEVTNELAAGSYTGDQSINYNGFLILDSIPKFVYDKNTYPAPTNLVISYIAVAQFGDGGKVYKIHGTYDTTLTVVRPWGPGYANLHIDF